MAKGAELLVQRSSRKSEISTAHKSAELPSRAEFQAQIEETQRSISSAVAEQRELRHSAQTVLPVNHELVARSAMLIEAFRPGLTGIGTRKTEALDALRGLNQGQFIELSRIYEDHTRRVNRHGEVLPGRNLISDLKKELSGSALEQAMHLVEGNQLKADVLELRRQFSKLNGGAERAAEILFRNRDNLDQLKAAYGDRFNGASLSEHAYRSVNGRWAPAIRALADGRQLDAAIALVDLEGRYPHLARVFNAAPGAPSNAGPEVAAVADAARIQANRERTHGAAAYVMRGVGAPAARQLRQSERVLNRTESEAHADGVISDAEGNAIREEAALLNASAAAFRGEKLRQADRMSTGAAAIAGAATPLAGSAPAGALAKLGSRYLLAGPEDYRDGGSPGRDLAVGAVVGAAAGVVASVSSELIDGGASNLVEKAGRGAVAEGGRAARTVIRK